MATNGKLARPIRALGGWGAGDPGRCLGLVFGGPVGASRTTYLAGGKHRSQLQLHGLDATCVAFLFIGLGAGLYFHYFWGLHQPSQDVSQVGKLGSALVMMLVLGTVVIRVLIRVF
jgi:hypothetical protein